MIKNTWLLLFFLNAVSVFSQQRNVKVYHEFVEGKTVVYADNDEFCPVSVLFRSELLNMKSSLKESYILVPAQAKRFAITNLSVVNLKKAFNFKYQSSFFLGDINLKKYDADFPYQLPYESGKSFAVIQGYNGKISHQGEFALDFSMPIGTEVLASRGGIVVDVEDKNTESCPKKACAEFNNFVVIFHDDGTFAEYTHIDTNSARVKKGDRVEAGTVVALSGNVGWSTGPHLHFFVFVPNIETGRQSLKTKFETISGKTEFLAEGKSYNKP
ncbi:peptidoglycan DD-metalloendopeptidase family protein [Flavobacterium sp. NST-5]|uniref:Peptidoglycan DD-metalloendopeptidase family protein n=1 Tax=Flavobacterium ichthyis TaxID=2698827 RepID=A0ABW9ZAH8_9FLAO|nr:M23 family metallopeptidase [Flavobacterium ichthyis]NBL65901.1 peptidoglycan DD-metalloendopeptidase family protein [Flavobacterium ichthyis]